VTETLLSILLAGRPAILLLATFLSCLAVPVPTSLMMLSAGAFVAAGDLALVSVAAAALSGAILGDQTGFLIGRRGGPAIRHRLSRRRQTARVLNDASSLLQRWGAPGIFLSRWLFSPLGPYVNFLAAGLGMNWATFTLWAGLGECVWVALYVGLGHVFSDQLSAVADALSNASWALAAGALTIGLGVWLIKSDQARKAPRP